MEDECTRLVPSLPSVYALSCRRDLRWHFCVVLLLTSGALAIDYLLAPSLYNGSTLWACGGLLVLVLRGKKGGNYGDSKEPLVTERVLRFPMFVFLHVAFVVAGHALASLLRGASLSYTLTATATALTKFLVLLPTFILFPLAIWRRVARAFRSELVACMIVLFTFFPYRIFETLWPWYSQILAHSVASIASWLVPNLVYRAGAIPMFAGPALKVSIVFACSGVESIRLFDLLFALVVAVEWRSLNKLKTLIAYLVGVVATLMANALRITLFVILGNRGSAHFVMRHHIYAGRVFFSVVFFGFLSLAYSWMFVGPERSQEAIRISQPQN